MNFQSFPRSARMAAQGCALALLCLLPQVGSAQDYPARPITSVVGFAAGSATDNLVRPLAVALQKSLRQPALIDNKMGAQGVVATQFVASEPAAQP